MSCVGSCSVVIAHLTCVYQVSNYPGSILSIMDGSKSWVILGLGTHNAKSTAKHCIYCLQSHPLTYIDPPQHYIWSCKSTDVVCNQTLQYSMPQVPAGNHCSSGLKVIQTQNTCRRDTVVLCMYILDWFLPYHMKGRQFGVQVLLFSHFSEPSVELPEWALTGVAWCMPSDWLTLCTTQFPTSLVECFALHMHATMIQSLPVAWVYKLSLSSFSVLYAWWSPW